MDGPYCGAKSFPHKRDMHQPKVRACGLKNVDHVMYDPIVTDCISLSNINKDSKCYVGVTVVLNTI